MFGVHFGMHTSFAILNDVYIFVYDTEKYSRNTEKYSRNTAM